MKSSVQSIEILHQDERIVAVAKPAGLAAIPGRGEKVCLITVVASQLGLPESGTIDPRLRMVHRLDKETSGVLLMAKDIDAQRCLSQQFQNNLVKKEYLALVVGRPAENEGEITGAIAPHPTARDRMAISKHGKPATTFWKVEKRMRNFTLLRCFPRTGRTHQIRTHLKSIGLPLAIDPLYHPLPPGREPGIFLSHYKRDYRPSGREQERPLIARLTLHAEKLTFKHPSDEEMTIECPPPKDFRAALMQLSKLS